MIEKTTPLAIRKVKNNSLRDDSKFIPDPYKKVASSMETQFLNFMISKMKNTINQNTPESSAVEYYNGLINKDRKKTGKAGRKWFNKQRTFRHYGKK